MNNTKPGVADYMLAVMNQILGWRNSWSSGNVPLHISRQS